MINVTVAGNLGSDAELKMIGDEALASFRVASTTKTKTGEVTTWVTANLWSKRAEALAPYLKKGTGVVITGPMLVREYDKRDGSGKGFSVDVRVSDIKLMGGKPDSARPSTGGGGPARAPAQPKFNNEPPPDAFAGEDEIPFMVQATRWDRP